MNPEASIRIVPRGPLGVIVCDIDGTLAERNRGISAAIADLLVCTVECGWRIIFLTGQPLANIEPRLIPALRQAMHQRGHSNTHFTLLTCEGASEWRFDSESFTGVPRGNDVKVIAKADQDRILAILNGNLSAVMPPAARILAGPAWIEDAMCVMKLDVSHQDRRIIADRLQSLFRNHDFASLRIGLGGTFSIIVTHESTHKGNALNRIIRDLGRGQIAIYLADEFDETGNDRVALQVENLVCFDFGRHRFRITEGPTAVAEWLQQLTTLSLSSDLSVELRLSRLPDRSRILSVNTSRLGKGRAKV